MKTVILEVRKDLELGELGFMVKGTPMMNYPMVATRGAVVAHDLLEHVNGVSEIGSVGDELEALGAAWYVRGQHGMVTDVGMSGDVYGLLELHNQGVPFRVDVKRTQACDYDDVFEYAIGAAVQSFLKYNEDVDANRLEEFKTAALSLMRTGYRKAKRKYKDFCVATLFCEIEREVDSIVKEIEYEGQEFKLRYDPLNVYVEEVYDYDDF